MEFQENAGRHWHRVSLHLLWTLQRSQECPQPDADIIKNTGRYTAAWQNTIEPWYNYLQSRYMRQDMKMKRKLLQEAVEKNVAALNSEGRLKFSSLDSVAEEYGWEVGLF